MLYHKIISLSLIAYHDVLVYSISIAKTEMNIFVYVHLGLFMSHGMNLQT